jgi:uncharacterized Tic20 family protein
MSIQPELSAPPLSAPAPLSTSDERTWAMLAHLSVLANLVTGSLGPLIPLIIYLVYKDRSRYVAYQSLQAFLFQLLWWVGGGVVIGVTWAGTIILMPVLVGFLCLPIAILISFLPLGVMVYGVIAGIRASQGEDFKYWIVGDAVRGTLTA